MECHDLGRANVASSGDTILVGDGVYESVSVNHNLQIHSINGPGVTTIEGKTNGAIARAVDLSGQCTLDGFSITKGGLTSEPSGVHTSAAVLTNCIIYGNKGGGVYNQIGTLSLMYCFVTNNAGLGVTGGSSGLTCSLTNCIVAGNSSGGLSSCTAYSCQVTNNIGGGAVRCSFFRCLIMGNYSTNVSGAGTADCRLENSLIISNRAVGSAGAAIYSQTAGSTRMVNCTIAYNSTGGAACLVNFPFLTNCILTKNLGPGSSEANNSIDARNCCTTPAIGLGSFTNDPQFMDPAHGDYTLQSNSPCINAGINSAITNVVDYAGNARISGGTVDLGAYEYQAPASVLSYIWAQTNGLATNGSADYTDADGDGMNSFQECRAGTNPTNPHSVLALQAPTSTNWTRAVNLAWQSTPGVVYSLARCHPCD